MQDEEKVYLTEFLEGLDSLEKVKITLTFDVFWKMHVSAHLYSAINMNCMKE